MIGFNYQEGVYSCDDVPLTQIAEQYGTPVYVYSARLIRKRCQNLLLALHDWLPEDRIRVFYASKANGNLTLLSMIHEEGLGIDIVSGGELKRALRANVPGSHIVFSGVGKSHDEIMLALENGVHQLNAESVPELERINHVATMMDVSVDVALRVNPDVASDTHAKISTGYKGTKFGVDIDRAPAVFDMAKNLPHVNLCALSIHIGSGILNLDNFENAFNTMARCVEKLRAQGHTVSRLDLGGGIGLPYKPGEKMPDLDHYARLIKEIILPLDTEIYLEPGKFITGDSAILLTSVEYTKQEDKRFLILNAGMNNLMRPALYDAYHPIVPVLDMPESPLLPHDIVGPICETTDIFARDRNIRVCEAGELVAICLTGAYGAAMANTYNAYDLAPEVMVDGSAVKLIRERWTIEDQMKLERAV